jgi:hypothetical protein
MTKVATLDFYQHNTSLWKVALPFLLPIPIVIVPLMLPFNNYLAGPYENLVSDAPCVCIVWVWVLCCVHAEREKRVLC